MKRSIVFFAVLFTASFSCSRTPVQEKPNAWDTFVQNYLDRAFEFKPDMAASEGKHEYDGMIPDWSSVQLAKEENWLREQKKRALAFDESQLQPEQKFERKYLLAITDGSLYSLTESGDPYRNPQFYGLDPNLYLSRPYAPLATRLRMLTKYLHHIPQACHQIQSNLHSPMIRPMAEQGILMFGGMVSFIEQDAPPVFASVEDPALQAEFKSASQEAVAALKILKAWFEKQKSIGTSHFAIGAERLHRMLMATELVPTPIAEIEKAGKKDLERNLQRLKVVCAQYAPGDSLKKCVDKTNANKPADILKTGNAQLAELKQFILDHDLMSIPSSQGIDVQLAPAYMRWNLAYMDAPGAYEKNLPSHYYVSPPDPSWPQKEKDDYLPSEGVLLSTSAHEVWPGHFLQFLHAGESHSQFGRIFETYAFAEGWAHYAEELMEESGLRDFSPLFQIGQITDALLRDVRLLSAIGLHTGKMTQAQSEKLFKQKAFQDPGNARQQAARGIFDPEYLKYTLGKLMIRKLRDDWCATRGGVKAWKAFHDQFLSYGGPPIPLIRAEMMGPGDQGSLF